MRKQIATLALVTLTYLVPQTVRAEPVVLEGEVSIIIADGPDNRSTHALYELKTKVGKYYKLEFGDARPELKPNQRVRVHGDHVRGVVRVPLAREPKSLEKLN